MKRQRVKITGIGPVTPAGIGRENFWKGILEPVSRVRPFARLGNQYGPLVAAYLDTFDVGKYVDAALLPHGSARHTLFAVAGSILALTDAGITVDELKRRSCAVVMGAALSDFGAINSSIESVSKLGSRGTKPRTVYTANTASIAGAVNDVLGVSARTMAIQSSCCSGLDAIGYAAALIAKGEIDLAICGGTEAPLYRFPLLEFRAAGLTPLTNDMPERLNRPFDLWRTTGVVSEGACMFVIEPEAIHRRGYSFVEGYAFANDHGNVLCSGIVTASRLALADARIRPSDIEAISAWGPGHRLIDESEARAMVEVFSSSLDNIPVASIKGSIGNPLGAAGAIQVAAAILAQQSGVIPPTVNWDYPDPACPLNLSNRSRILAHSVTMVNGHGLAGVNSSMILERC